VTAQEEIQSIEESTRELRLTEQSIFRGVLESKNKKFKKLMLLTTISFVIVGALWGLLHCMPLILSSKTG